MIDDDEPLVITNKYSEYTANNLMLPLTSKETYLYRDK